MGWPARFLSSALALCLLVAVASTANAFLGNGHWTATANQPSTPPLGSPITLTWSIVPDNTQVAAFSNTGSKLIQFFDNLYGTSGSADLTTRPWFTPVQAAFDRWGALSGVNFIYQAIDDGAQVGQFTNGNTQFRGDVRLAGVPIDGTAGTYGSTAFISGGGDISLDTGDTAYFGNVANNYLNLRDTLGHEIGHAMGLGHTESQNGQVLMAPLVPVGGNVIDGPQFDDVRGIQNQMGDFYEKANGGAGNNTAANAIPLATISSLPTYTVGTAFTGGMSVSPAATDFVSIARSSDVDFYSFTTSSPSTVDITLTPVGFSYNERHTDGNTGSYAAATDTAATSNLSLQLWGMVGGVATMLTTVDANPAGEAENIAGYSLAQSGTYYVRVGGNVNTVQLYSLAVTPTALPLPGDYNHDNVVDALDYVLWQDTYGSTTSLAADGSGNSVVDDDDFMVWKTHFGNSQGSGGVGPGQVPEPGAGLICASGFAAVFGGCMLRTRNYLRVLRVIC